MNDHAETVRLARDLAVMLEENRNAEIDDRWDVLLSAVRKDFNEECPEAMAKLSILKIGDGLSRRKQQYETLL